MLKAKFKKLLALIIAGTMISGSIPVSAADNTGIAAYADETTAFAVSFDNSYAKVGTALTVTVTGAENVSYQWYVDEKLVSGNQTNSYTPTENDLEKWIKVEVRKGTETLTQEMYCSKLPVVYINTENEQAITSKEEYIDAMIRIQGNDSFESTGIDEEMKTEIRGRGNSTWGQPKKPYKLKLNKKKSVLGMDKSKHWVLLANYLDESLMRNTLSYNLSDSMDMVSCQTVWVDLILNGEYVGNYQLCENVRVDKNRVNVYDWEGFAEDAAAAIASAESLSDADAAGLETLMTENMAWITSGEVTYNNVTYSIENYPAIEYETTEEEPFYNGGYLIELDEYWDEVSKFETNSGQPIQIKTPEFVGTNDDMIGYVQDYIQAFEDAVQSSDYTADYNNASTHYSDLYDMDALVDYWLVTEIFFNEEMNKKSTYMYKDLDGKMIMGPIWDMDWSSGAGGTSTTATNRWATEYFSLNAQQYQWYKYLVQDPYFLMKVQERYWEIRNDQVQDMLDVMPEHYELLKESGQADSALWHGWSSVAFDSDYTNLKTWLNTHISWMDQQMATEDSLEDSFTLFTANSSSINLTLTDSEGNELSEDYAAYAPADGLASSKEDLVLHISSSENSRGTANVFINSKLAGTVTVDSSETTYNIPASALTEAAESKNVIEVKLQNTSGYNKSVTSNYITVRQTEHNYAKTWSYDATQHWRACTDAGCDAKIEPTAHTLEWVIDTPATENANGTRHQKCTICAYESASTEYEYVALPTSPDDDSKDMDVSSMTAISGSENSGNEDDYILDDDENTMWHTEYGMMHKIDERWCGVSLEEAAIVSGIRCLPRNDGSTNGVVSEYRIEYRTSDDGEWTEIATGTWEDSSDRSWKMVTFTPVMAKQVRIVGVQTYYNGEITNKHMSMAEFRLISGGSGTIVDPDPTDPPTDPNPTDPVDDLIPVSEMTATAGDYEQDGGTEGPQLPSYAIDENENTMWHTSYRGVTDYTNYWLQLTLKDVYMISSLRYLPRQTGTNGIITEYEIFTSVDGDNWTSQGSGKWDADSALKIVTFETPVEAKYVKLSVIDALTDQSYVFASAAEVRLTGTKKVEETPVVPSEVDKTALNHLIAEANKLSSSNYTEESWAAFYQQLQNAITISENAAATEIEVANACTSLQTAMEQLVKVSTEEPEETDKEQLEIVIANTKNLDKDNYTEESWTAAGIERVIADAEQVLQDPDATAEEVNNAIAALTEAAQSLIKKEESEPAPVVNEVIRVEGQVRVETSRKVADELKTALGKDKFDTIIIATSGDFADALTGSYLAIVKGAPILLSNGKTAADTELLAYVQENASADAQIYILGETAAVSEETEAMFTKQFANVERLGGQSRLETNKKILDAAGLDGQTELLVATSKGYADSLSASATGKPILLVNPEKELSPDQKEVLDNFKNGKVYIIGGSSAVSDACEAKITEYVGEGVVERVADAGRYSTSVAVAKKFFAGATKAVIATGDNYPDGLCGGPLAAALNAPLLLTRDGNTKAADYAKEAGITSGYVLGGDRALADDTVKAVFSVDEIIEK